MPSRNRRQVSWICGGGLVLGEALHDVGGRDEGVVGLVRLAAVARGAPHPQLHPAAALLRHDHRELDARGARDRDAAALGDDVVGPHRIGLVVHEVPGAERPERLLVGHRQVHERALGAEPAAGEVLRGHGHRRREVEHVDGAAAPHLAVDELAAERVVAPSIRVRGHDVRVTHQQQRRRVGIGALDARDEAGATGRRLVALEGEARTFEVRREQVRAAHLLPRLPRAVVHARVADEVLQEVGDLLVVASAVAVAIAPNRLRCARRTPREQRAAVDASVRSRTRMIPAIARRL